MNNDPVVPLNPYVDVVERLFINTGGWWDYWPPEEIWHGYLHLQAEAERILFGEAMAFLLERETFLNRGYLLLSTIAGHGVASIYPQALIAAWRMFEEADQLFEPLGCIAKEFHEYELALWGAFAVILSLDGPLTEEKAELVMRIVGKVRPEAIVRWIGHATGRARIIRDRGDAIRALASLRDRCGDAIIREELHRQILAYTGHRSGNPWSQQ